MVTPWLHITTTIWLHNNLLHGNPSHHHCPGSVHGSHSPLHVPSTSHPSMSLAMVYFVRSFQKPVVQWYGTLSPYSQACRGVWFLLPLFAYGVHIT
ncbi:hypothetical protein E2C01_055456 [Portunus trituberculatus]|uniref:Uncharacterized protein n=1 Tax=Portunus trituberculatus TaxID=210409 RepID=A0A5B7GXS2_PORTR|nr:hypothetical protein [Portunus trituberculatus]